MSARVPAEAPRRRLGRTLSRARWAEYPALLDAALEAGYDVVSVETFLEHGPGRSERTLILRHDVDQDARSALKMLRFERERKLRSTWYFRWRTASPRVISTVREAGSEVGLHYETLTRLVLTRGRPIADGELEPLVRSCREVLKAEIAVFGERFGSTRSVAAHGDTRVPGVRNGDLLRGADARAFGIAWDANEAMRQHALASWLTDRSRAQGSWSDGADPHALLDAAASPILCLTHPNNWVSGIRLWTDRAVRHIQGQGDRPPL